MPYHATLSLVSHSLSLSSLSSRRPPARAPRAAARRGGRRAPGGAGRGAGGRARRSSSRSTSTRPYSHTRIAPSPRNGRARSTVNRRPRPEPPSACRPRPLPGRAREPYSSGPCIHTVTHLEYVPLLHPLQPARPHASRKRPMCACCWPGDGQRSQQLSVQRGCQPGHPRLPSPGRGFLA